MTPQPLETRFRTQIERPIASHGGNKKLNESADTDSIAPTCFTALICVEKAPNARASAARDEPADTPHFPTSFMPILTMSTRNSSCHQPRSSSAAAEGYAASLNQRKLAKRVFGVDTVMKTVLLRLDRA